MTVDEYFRLLDHDLRILEILHQGGAQAPLDTSDWKTTLLFYMACIYVRATALAMGVTISNHREATTWLNTGASGVHVAADYRMLQDRSQAARYMGRVFQPKEMWDHFRWFIAVRDRVMSLLKQKGLNPPLINPFASLP
jgi:hypothetical protein